MAKGLASRLGYSYVDSGAMYRAVALHAMRNGWADGSRVDAAPLIASLDNITMGFRHNAHTGMSDTLLNGENVEEEIRSMAVSAAVSHVSRIPEVRTKLRLMQQQMGSSGGVVMDGRDIGTAVFPQAELKIFMTADPEIRAMRRFNELKSKGKDVSLNEIRKNLSERDYEDTHRVQDPLRQAEDAVMLDNSDITPAQQLEMAEAWAHERMG